MLAHELIERSQAIQEPYKIKRYALAAAANFLIVEREKLRNSIHTSMTADQAREQSENIAILRWEIERVKGEAKRS